MSKTLGILGIVAVLCVGACCMFQSGVPVGDVATTAETANIWAGSCTAEAEGGARTVCSGQDCSGGTCGCARIQPWKDSETGASPCTAVECGSSKKIRCTASQELSGTCANY